VRFLALLLLGAALAGCGSSSPPAPAERTQSNLQTIFEDEGHLHADPAGTLDLLARLGVDRVRVYVPWQSLAPAGTSAQPPANFAAADPAAYPPAGWSVYDQIVRDAAQRGIGVDMTVGGPVPVWALGHGAPRSPWFSWKPSANAFGAFVHAVGTRYSGHYKPAGATAALPRVNFWSIWNEPNYGPDLAPQAIDHSRVEVSPLLYRQIVDAAWSALRQTGHGADAILIGETAPRGVTTGNNPGNFSGMVPLRFVRALYCVDSSFHPLTGPAATARGCPSSGDAHAFVQSHPALFAAAGFADHPYPQGGMPPDALTPYEPDYADMASLPHLEQTLDRATAAYGVDVKFPIYSTEFGYQTNPPETIEHTTDPATAALYMNWSEYLSWRDPRVRSYDQFLLTDPPGANASGGFATGLEFKDGTPKATYDAFLLPLFLPGGASGGSVEVWGCARPAKYARVHGGSTPPVHIQYRAGAAGPFKTVETLPVRDPHGYFDVHVKLALRGSVRLSWTYPHGATIHSRVALLGSH
jgi:hypothetical protein